MENPSWRKPVGMLAILLALGLWAVAVVTLADAARLGGVARPAAFVVAGFLWLWVLPMRRLLRWMELGVWRDPPTR